MNINQENINKFEEDIMRLLRTERGLDKNDTSEDIQINSYSVNEAYKNLLKFGWYSDFDVKITTEYLNRSR